MAGMLVGTGSFLQLREFFPATCHSLHKLAMPSLAQEKKVSDFSLHCMVRLPLTGARPEGYVKPYFVFVAMQGTLDVAICDGLLCVDGIENTYW
jgi:hypothetical protein